MIPPEMVIVPVVFGAPASVVALLFWFRHREKMASIAAGRSATSDVDRLARLEQAVEAIAVEMERVGEGQRFLTKVLAERLPAGSTLATPELGRVSTPR